MKEVVELTKKELEKEIIEMLKQGHFRVIPPDPILLSDPYILISVEYDMYNRNRELLDEFYKRENKKCQNIKKRLPD